MTPLPLVFVRHGETDWNVAGRLQGSVDTPLNARGRDQSASVGRALLETFPDIGERRFFVSPQIRAQDTARLMRQAMGVLPDDFTTDPRLREMSFGRWEGSTFREITAREPGVVRARSAARWTHRPPDGESYEDLAERVQAFLGDLDGPAVLVSHGGVARALLSLMTSIAHDKLAELRIPQGRAVAFEAKGWRWI